MSRSKPNTLRFSITETELGKLLLAAGDEGLQFVAIGDQSHLLADLRIFAGSDTILQIDPVLSDWAIKIVNSVKLGISIELPMDPVGTDFQKRVWTELTHIPAGQTITYAQLAERISQPSAVRAVARACGANNLAIVIPCHRVIGSNGQLTGFRWGIQIKQKLLEWEQIPSEEQLSLI